jgi:hypothetical protein
MTIRYKLHRPQADCAGSRLPAYHLDPAPLAELAPTGSPACAPSAIGGGPQNLLPVQFLTGLWVVSHPDSILAKATDLRELSDWWMAGARHSPLHRGWSILADDELILLAEGMTDQRQWYAGVDWASESHHVFLTDGEWSKKARGCSSTAARGSPRWRLGLMATSGAVEGSKIQVAIEVPHGPVSKR